MAETPRTDARVILMLSDLQSGTMDVVHADFARQLERESAAKDQELAGLQHDISSQYAIATELASDLVAAEQELARMREALEMAEKVVLAAKKLGWLSPASIELEGMRNLHLALLAHSEHAALSEGSKG